MYSQLMFGRVADALTDLARRPYAVTILCGADFPFVQDGTRQEENFRRLQQAWYRDSLQQRQIHFELLEGALRCRVDTAVRLIQDTLR